MKMDQMRTPERKRVRLVPIPYSNPPVEREVDRNKSVRRVVRESFPNIEGRLLFQDEQDRPIDGSTKARDVNEIRFLPYTEGYVG